MKDPITHVYEIYADGVKTGIVVSHNIEAALAAAISASTRKTDSKMDISCDYSQVEVVMMESGERQMVSFITAMAAEKSCKLFGEVKVESVGALTFQAARYAYVGAPLAIRALVKSERGAVEPFADLTSNIPRNTLVRVGNDEVIVRTHSENEVLRQPMLDSGYFADTGKRIASAFVQLEVWRLMPAFIEEFRQRNKHWTKFNPA
jgi:hypothetical protein